MNVSKATVTLYSDNQSPTSDNHFFVLGGGCHPLSMTTSGNHQKKWLSEVGDWLSL